MRSDVQWQNYLNEATDAILTGESVERVRSRYGITYQDDESLIDLIDSLNMAFPPVEPSAQFAGQLKDELTGVDRTGVVWRIRRLPARVQWAAVVTAVLGGIIFVLQRLAGEGFTLRSEEQHTSLPEEG